LPRLGVVEGVGEKETVLVVEPLRVREPVAVALAQPEEVGAAGAEARGEGVSAGEGVAPRAEGVGALGVGVPPAPPRGAVGVPAK
jgi:hypothetical protein